MDSLAQADIFFFISSFALVVLTVLCVVILLYVLTIVRTISEIAQIAKKKAKEFSYTIDEVEQSIENSFAMRWIRALGTPKKKRKARASSE